MKNNFFLILIVANLLVISACKEEDLLSKDYTEIEKIAKDQTVRFYMWGGHNKINKWVTEDIASKLSVDYQITLEQVPIKGAGDYLEIMEKEKEESKGSIDLIWINGGNFKKAKESNLLFGPFTNKLPNFNEFIDSDTVKYDFGYQTEGYESPWGKVQFIFIYDTVKVPNPPKSFKDLEFWVKENPGKFTYPTPGSIQGTAFLRQAFYAVTGGYEQYLSGYDEEYFQEKVKYLWDYLNRIKPYLWKNGRSFPENINILETLFINNEVDFTMAYTYTNAQMKIEDGIYPETVRSFIMKEGSLYNTNFVAIPANSPNKAAAMVTANLLLSEEVQYQQNLPSVWGSMTVLSIDKLGKKYQDLFNNMDLGEATLPLGYLYDHAVPEISSDFDVALIEGWKDKIGD